MSKLSCVDFEMDSPVRNFEIVIHGTQKENCRYITISHPTGRPKVRVFIMKKNEERAMYDLEIPELADVEDISLNLYSCHQDVITTIHSARKGRSQFKNFVQTLRVALKAKDMEFNRGAYEFSLTWTISGVKSCQWIGYFLFYSNHYKVRYLADMSARSQHYKIVKRYLESIPSCPKHIPGEVASSLIPEPTQLLDPEDSGFVRLNFRVRNQRHHYCHQVPDWIEKWKDEHKFTGTTDLGLLQKQAYRKANDMSKGNLSPLPDSQIGPTSRNQRYQLNLEEENRELKRRYTQVKKDLEETKKDINNLLQLEREVEKLRAAIRISRERVSKRQKLN